MKRPLRADEIRLWAAVASTVRPAPGKAALAAPEPALALLTPPPPPTGRPFVAASAPKAHKAPFASESAVWPIEPLRRRRIARERDPISAHLDLHGLDQDRARAVLKGFLRQAYAEGSRSVLVITGKGSRGDGVLRRRVPEWLTEPDVRPLIAGISPADRRHGGDGALYIALKRRRI